MRSARCTLVAMSIFLGGLAWLAAPAPASGIEAFDGRLQIHGAVSQQFRVVADGYRVRDHFWFLSKMQTRLSLEIEAEILPDGWGPIDILEGFARLDFSYDCVYEHACHMAPQWNYFGDDVRRAPENLANGRTRGVTGAVSNPLEPIVREQPDNRLVTIGDIDPFQTLLNLGSEESINRVFGEIFEAKFTTKHMKGSLSPLTFGIGPLNPEFEIDSTGFLADKPLPLGADLPLRPGKIDVGLTTPGRLSDSLFIPSPEIRRRRDRYDNPDVNFTENELAWNLGASQQQTKFLREAYVDATLLEGRLVLRLGKQITRWGKTELFRSGSPDQLNPQDLAISNLPSFEDSLIALWQARAVYSLYNLGPFQDFRVELAVNLDHFEPADLGDCGEPYTVWLVCQKQFGLLAHGFSGLGVSGEDRPPNWWDDATGLEFGARVEFRIGRFSVSITDFYGYNDFPTPDFFADFERNVDPATGRPRVFGAEGTGTCVTGTEPDCLTEENAAALHHGNQQLFQVFCAATQGFEIGGGVGAVLGPALANACAIALFSEPAPLFGPSGVPELVSFVLGDGDFFTSDASGPGLCLVVCNIFGRPNQFQPGFPGPLANIPLHPGAADMGPGGAGVGLDAFLTDEQEALLGCGPFYGTSCHDNGVDLFNMEASVFFQRFPQMEGGGIPLNGVVGTRFVQGVGVITLPGARSPFRFFDDPAGFRYDPRVDGCVVDLNLIYSPGQVAQIPNAADCNGYRVPVPDGVAPALRTTPDQTGVAFTVEEIRERFPSEMAVVSENLKFLLIGIAGLIDPDAGCSLEQPLRCEFLNALFEASAQQRPELRSGGNGRFGRRDFTWLAGSPVELFYERRNVFAVSTDFTEDRTKTSWGIDFTWIEDQPYQNTRAERGFSLEDTLNLIISVDRPTFINFLNQNRTVFFNAQVFLSYIPDYQRRDTFLVDGPVSALATLTAFTGFFQDRLMTFLTLVHEVESNSGGQIFAMTYRFTESFSVSVGLSAFYGDPRRQRVHPRSPVTRFHCCDFTQRSNFQGVSAIAERDEIFFSIRHTF